MPLNAVGLLGSLIEDQSSQLSRDRFGLSAAQAVWNFVGTWAELSPLLPLNGSVHPIFSFLELERLEVNKNARFWTVQGYYFGIDSDSTEAVFELDRDTGLEPIETHPDFASFAGTAAAPLNGAKFDSDELFIGFADTAQPEWCGVTSYYRAGALWTETYCSRFEPNDLNNVGEIQNPDGWQPNISQSKNWLYLGLTYTQRGNCYLIRKMWKASGALGWNTTIY